MMEMENPKSLAERVARIEDRVGPIVASNSLTALSWMRWIPATVVILLLTAMIVVGTRIILVPLLASVALAYLLGPMTSWFERRGWSRTSASLLTIAFASLVLVLALMFLVPAIWSQSVRSYEQARTMLGDSDRVNLTLERIKIASPTAYEYLVQLVDSFRNPMRQAQVRSIAIGWMQSGLFGLVNITTSILDLLLIPFFVFYLLCDYRQVRSRIEQLIPPRHRVVASELIGKLSRVLSTYVRNQMLISLTMGVLYGIGFSLLRVPLGLSVGLLAGLLNFVPYLGTLTGLILSVVFVALDGAGLWRVVGVLAVFGAVQALEGYYLTPKLLGTSLNLHPMLVLMALMVGGNLFGLLGIVLSVPVLAAVKVVFNFLESVYQESDFFRRSGSDLLTGAGAPVDLGSPAASAVTTIIEVDEPTPREPRVVITTGELRSRRPPPNPTNR